MPRKQRFKPTRKPKLTNESAVDCADQPNRPTSDDQARSQQSEPRPDEERRLE